MIFAYSSIFQRGKRISKVRVLQRAIDYILNMRDMVEDHDVAINGESAAGGKESFQREFEARFPVGGDDSRLFDF